MGAYLDSPITKKDVEEKENDLYNVAVVSMQGWRRSMEDMHLLDLDAGIFGVFDGHGGKETAIFVQKHFMELLTATQNYREGFIPQALRDTFLKLDESMKTKKGKKELRRTQRGFSQNREVTVDSVGNMSGSTAVVAQITDRKLTVAWVGDSRCVIAKAGTAVPMTFDHKPDIPAEKQRITNAGGVVADGRINHNLNLSRSLGDLQYKSNTHIGAYAQIISAYPDIQNLELTSEHDFMLVACDGIWDVLTCQEAVDFVYQRLGVKTPSEILTEMFDKCVADDPESTCGLGCDNMTAILVLFK